jgi:vacuolar-type H+-ATPase subunit C/Vma6
VSSSWEYTAGRISALETTLLQDRAWSQITAAPGIAEMMKVLSDTWYGRLIQGDDLDAALDRAVSAAEDELVELDPESGLSRALLRRRDVRNARYVWKNLATAGTEEPPREREGTLPLQTIAGAWDDPAAGEQLPGNFRTALEEVRGRAPGDSLGVDLIMDRLAADVERTELGPLDPGLTDYVMAGLELRNFLTAGRLRGENPAPAQMEAWLLPGGYHSPEEVSEAFRKGRLIEALSENPGFEAASAALKEALEDGSFLTFARESDRILLGRISSLAGKTFGPGLLASYVLGREMEAVHLNLAAAAKRAGMSTSKLLTRLPR